MVSNVALGTYSLNADVALIHSGQSFKFTGVYGPTRGCAKDTLFDELRALKPAPVTKQIAIGDFNHIHRARDKTHAN